MKTNMKIAYNTQFVSSLTGATIAQLNRWNKIKLVQPSILKSEGRGTIRLYSYEDIIEAKTVVYLKNNGHSIQKIKKAIDFIKENFPYNRPLKDLTLLSNGIDIIFTDENINFVYSKWIAANRYGQTLMEFVVPFGCIVDDINNTIEKYNKRLEEAELQEQSGELIDLESIREEYFGVSDKANKKRSRKIKSLCVL